MLRLKDKSKGPPDEFRYVHAETGHLSKAVNFWAWEEAIMSHRKANNLPIPGNMMDLAQDQICRTIGPEWCEHSDEATHVSTRFNFGDVVNGMKALGKMMLGLVEFVSQEEADRRARVCAGCYFNVNAEGCGSCRKIAELISGPVAKKKTAWDHLLKVCAICRCSNAAKVWFPLDEIPTDETQQALFPTFCWQRVGSPNYVPNEELAVA